MKRIVLILAILLLLQAGCAKKPESLPVSTVTPVSPPDIPAADIRFYDESHMPFTLSDAFGTPILLKFWSAEHADAEAEMRTLVKVYGAHKDSVLFYLIDLTENAAKKQQLFEEHPDIVPPFPCYFDPDGSCRTTYGLSGTQAAFFIDRDGFLATWADGTITEEALLFGLKMI